MKYILFFLLTLYICSCQSEKKQRVISVDLTQSSSDVKYSQFISSLDYITLNPGDTCLLSGIKKIYFDEDTIIVQDTKRDGICVFTSKGDFIKQINYIGNGPKEYHNSNAIAVDTIHNHIQVYDVINFKINTYTYQGKFIESNKVDYFMQDFEIFENGNKIMIQPYNNKTYKKNGVWLSSLQNKFVKQYIEHEPTDEYFEFLSKFANKTSAGIYYYDRNNDNMYVISSDSVKQLFVIDLKQRIPSKVRYLTDPTPMDLAQHSMMYDFCISPNIIVLNYFTFEEKTNPFKWVFIDAQTGKNTICKDLKNDIDNIETSDYRIFYINDSTWCRVIDAQQKDCNTLIQIMHLK